MGEYGQGNVGDIVKKKTVVFFSEVQPGGISYNYLLSEAQKFGGSFSYLGGEGSKWTFRGTRLRLSDCFATENFYVRVSYGYWWRDFPDPNVYDWIYRFQSEPLTDWLSVQAGPDWLEINCPDFIYEEKKYSGDDSVYSNVITVNYLRKDSNDPPPFPYDPNNPNPPQSPQSVGNLYCKTGGVIHKAKKLYTKQNGVIVPVKTIRGR